MKTTETVGSYEIFGPLFWTPVWASPPTLLSEVEPLPYACVKLRAVVPALPILTKAAAVWEATLPEMAHILKEWMERNSGENPELITVARFRIPHETALAMNASRGPQSEHWFWERSLEYVEHTRRRFSLLHRDTDAVNITLMLESGFTASIRAALLNESDNDEMSVTITSSTREWAGKFLFQPTGNFPFSSSSVLESIVSGSLRRIAR